MASLNVPQDRSVPSQDQEGNENKDDGRMCGARMRTAGVGQSQTLTIRRKEDGGKGWRAIFLRVCIGLADTSSRLSRIAKGELCWGCDA